MDNLVTINNTEVAVSAAPVNTVDPVTDFLQENGLNGMTEETSVIQRNGTIVTIPNGNNTTDNLTNTDIEEVLDSLEIEAVSSPIESEVVTPVKTPKAKGPLPELPSDDIAPETATRFSGAMWYKQVTKQSIIVAGQGGIGSWISMILSRMRPAQVFLYDDDVVEAVNLAGQCYGLSSVGKKKVTAMASFVEDFSDYHACMAIPAKFTPDTTPGDIMICGFDNMKARFIYFNSWRAHVLKSEHPEKCLFIDGRLAMDNFQVFCITGDDTYNQNKYATDWLFGDSVADETVCSMKQTTYCACMIGSVIVNLFTNFIANQISPMSHDLPFKTYYDSNMLYFKTES